MLETPLETVADYVGDARTLLLDVIAPFRYDDPSLLIALNVTLLDARRLRPDLFVYQWCEEVPNFDAVDSDPVPIEPPFRLGVLYGMVGHALARDQEDVQDARATSFLGLFRDIMVGPAQARVVLQGGSSGR